MNTFHSSQSACGKFCGFLSGTLALLMCASSARADFSGVFSLTPPAVGSYINSPNSSTFGGWILTTPGTGDLWGVDTGLATTNLTLFVLDFVGEITGPTALTLTTAPLPFAGTIQFDFLAAYGFNSPQIAFQVNGFDVAGYINPSSGSASIPVLLGDTFGFRLSAITAGDVASQATLTVFNIVPEPQVGILSAFGLAILGFGLRRRRV
jgi:hypothetical protein